MIQLNYFAPVIVLVLVVSILGCSSSTVRVLEPTHKLYYLQAQAAAGDPDAQFHLGYRYMTGREIRKNETTGVYWLMRAANQDHAAAQFAVGFSYRYGNGVTRNIERAIHWYTKSSAHGRPSALHELGDIYYNGIGVVQNYSIAVLCFFLAASQGYVNSQMQLGIAYALGQGVEQDVVEGHMYLNLASVRNQEAREARVILESNMTSEQVYEAQSKALNWEANSWDDIKSQLEEALEEMNISSNYVTHCNNSVENRSRPWRGAQGSSQAFHTAHAHDAREAPVNMNRNEGIPREVMLLIERQQRLSRRAADLVQEVKELEVLIQSLTAVVKYMNKTNSS